MNALGQIVHNPLLDALSELLNHDIPHRKIDCFESETGIHGQAWTEGDDLHLLTVMATREGKGQLRAFMKECKQQYRQIYVWHVMNPVLGKILRAYGFRRSRRTEPDGEVLIGYRWRSSSDQ